MQRVVTRGPGLGQGAGSVDNFEMPGEAAPEFVEGDRAARKIGNATSAPPAGPNGIDFMVNRAMVASGFAKNLSVTSPYKISLDEASADAKERGLGIYSPQCRSAVASSNCTIKGNITQGIKEYYPTSCKTYKEVIVDLSFGDAWFCTVSQARDAGFVLSKSCQ